MSKVWLPAPSAASVCGLVQEVQLPPSRRHSKVDHAQCLAQVLHQFVHRRLRLGREVAPVSDAAVEGRHRTARHGHDQPALERLPADAGPKYPSELSGGMRKRAGLARALALDPELLFLDEPTAGLDPIGAAAFDELIANLKQRLELTVFLITHDLDTLYAICDRVAVLSDKKVVAVGTIDELLALDHPWIQEYFNGPRGRAASAGLQKGQRDS